jgi:signal transduction histidine kinase/putative methionine-R-sulfoxide reductase with GAF domain
LSYADVTSSLKEALEQQAATTEILRVISSSPTHIQPIFDAIASSAVRLCEARIATVFRFDGELIHLIAHHGYTPEALELRRGLFPAPPHAGSVTGRAILNHTVVHVPDVLTDGTYPYRDFARAADVRSVVAVPMFRDGRPIGVITASRAEPGAFAERHIEVLKTFADQAVIAVETVRLVTELETRNRELTETLEQQAGTDEILRIISTSPTELQPVLEAVIKSAAQLCGAHDAAIFQLDGESLRVAAHQGLLPGAIGLLLPVAQGTVAGRSVLERRAVHVADLPTEAKEFPEGSAFARELGYRTTLSVPLLRQGTAIGTIQLRRAEMNPFTDKQVALLQTFADQAVIAIENARLFKELQARNADLTQALEQQTALGDILKAMTRSAFGLEPVLTAIIENAGRLCGADQGAIHQLDGEFLKLGATYRTPPEYHEYARSHPVRAGRGSASGRAAIERRPVHIHDVLADAEYQMFERQRVVGFRTFLAVPMLRDQTVVGVINLWKMQVAPFTDEQMHLLQTFADQAVIAIENVRLFKELEARTADLTRSVGELQALGEVGQAISSTLDLQTVLGAIVARATQLAGVDAGVIYEYDEEHEVFEPRATHHLEEEIVQTLVASPVRKGEGATGRLAELREPIQWPDIRTPTFQSPVRDLLLRVGYRGLLAVPLLREDHLVGGLTVIRKVSGEFEPAIVQLLTTFATQSVLAIQNARLFREIEEKSRELEALSRNMEQLYRLSTAMQEPLSLREQLGRVLETATRIGLLDRIYVWAVSPEGNELVNLASAGFAEDEWKQFEGFAIPLAEAGAMSQSLRERRPLLFDDENPLPRDLYLKPPYLLKGLRTNRFLVIPMIARGETVGVFTGDNKPSGRPIRRETVELLQTFASHGAVAIANARLFQTIEEKSRELEVASQHKSEFLANMSHELRTPLNAIIGFSEVLLERMFGEVNDKQVEYLQDIVDSGRHLLSLINDILDLSKIEAGRMELEPADFDLPQAIDNALMLMRERAARRAIALHQAVDPHLGQITGDERKVKQVLLNLLSNALKFTPEGGRIDVRASLVQGTAEISVADTGVGIAPEDQEAVFEEFRQVGGSEKKAEGTGLGLTLCRKFVELHGGRIWVKSQVGQGSTFTFTLPRQR